MIKKRKSFPELCSTVLINEIIPREKKYGVKVPPRSVGLIVKDEHDGKITRKETRELLDKMFLEAQQQTSCEEYNHAE